jgi:hypothetical protein
MASGCLRYAVTLRVAEAHSYQSSAAREPRSFQRTYEIVAVDQE